jgi:hypothetical protein
MTANRRFAFRPPLGQSLLEISSTLRTWAGQLNNWVTVLGEQPQLIRDAGAVAARGLIFVTPECYASRLASRLYLPRSQKYVSGWEYWCRKIMHEREHLYQFARPFGWVRYALLFLRYGYRNHPYEVAARRAAGQE